MKANTTQILIFLFLSAALKAQYNQTILFPNDSSFQLISKLVEHYKPVSVLDYTMARIKMYREIYNQNDSVSCVYSHHTLYLDPASTNPIDYIIKNGTADGINCEHSFPQSKGAGTGNARSDIHHLYPAKAAVNEARSNFPYSEIEDSKTMIWYYKSIAQSNIPNQQIDEYSESINGFFEPREDAKGNVARAIFYFYTMYELQADRIFFDRMKTTLCNWHLKDPVDSLEWTRSYLIAGYQDLKPNPFVLDCSLLKRSYCSTHPECNLNTSVGKTENIDFTIEENPFHDQLRIRLNNIGEPVLITLRQVSGQTVFKNTFNGGSIIVDTKYLSTGLYLLQLQTQQKAPISRVLVKR